MAGRRAELIRPRETSTYISVGHWHVSRIPLDIHFPMPEDPNVGNQRAGGNLSVSSHPQYIV